MGGAARKVRVSGGGRCNFTNLDMDPGALPVRQSALYRARPWRASRRGTPWPGCGESRPGLPMKRPRASFLRPGRRRRGRALEAECARGRGAPGAGPPGARRGARGRRVLVRTRAAPWPPGPWPLPRGACPGPRLEPRAWGSRSRRPWGARGAAAHRPGYPLSVGTRGGNWPYRTSPEWPCPCARPARGVVLTDDLLFTHKGLSGPVILQISNYWRRGEALTIDRCPGRTPPRCWPPPAAPRAGAGPWCATSWPPHLPGRWPRALPPRSLPRRPLRRSRGRPPRGPRGNPPPRPPVSPAMRWAPQRPARQFGGPRQRPVGPKARRPAAFPGRHTPLAEPHAPQLQRLPRP
jgi:hypothetical protein